VRIAGVSIEGRGTPAVIGSVIHSNRGAGIAVRGPAAPVLSHNQILDNGRSGTPAPGIEVESGARPEIAGNVIAGNGAGGIRGLSPAARGPALERNVFTAFGRANRRGAIVSSRAGRSGAGPAAP
jgi:hypothetical protein